ncbi:MAG: hypothetical protein JSS62_03255 [Verrucomicrobia bacterium]|nr:hypothetical protein [Verrucomicrobiota bacterium]MBS0646687.1 hypothetical protein [Verrucomicrobiota bacterium]
MNFVCLNLNQNNLFFHLNGEKIESCSATAPDRARIAEQIQINNIDPQALQNITNLFLRKKGEVFCVKDGQLQVLSRWSLKQRYHWTRKERQQEVQDAVKQAMEALQAALEPHANNDAVKKVFKACFFKECGGVIGRLSKRVFDRSVVQRQGCLEKLLANDSFFESENKLQQALVNSDGLSETEHRSRVSRSFYRFCYEESRFADQLGLQYKSMGVGSGGAYKGFSRHAQPLVIRKASDEGPYGVNNNSLSSRIKRLFLSQRACLAGNSEARSEGYSHQLSEALELQNVPPTYVEYERGGKEYSVQLFVSDARSLGDEEELNISSLWRLTPRCLRGLFRFQLQMRQEIGRIREGENMESVDESSLPSGQMGRLCLKIAKKTLDPLPQLPKVLFEKAAILKFLSGDIDTHFDNILVKHHKETRTEASILSRRFVQGNAEEFTKGIFGDNTHYHLLDELLKKEDNWIFANHDGGAAFPHQHNQEGGMDGYLSGRFRCLFEVLPVCSESFADQTKAIFLNEQQNERMVKFILAQSFQELVVRFEKDMGVFNEFWSHMDNRLLFREWILGTGNLDQICRNFTLINFKKAEQQIGLAASYENVVRENLMLIKGSCSTLMDRYRLLVHHLQQTPQEPMRELFLLIDEDQIRDKVAAIGEKDNGFSALLQDVISRPMLLPSIEGGGVAPATLKTWEETYPEQIERLYGNRS